ncbi:inactive pancreatic lipase-related protein 1-like, partial [Aphis craccivora]
TLSCDHTKVTPYFIESINSNIGFWSIPCSNRFYFNLGLCNPPESEYVLMGEHSPRYLLLAYKREKTLRQRLPQKVIVAKPQHEAQPSTIHIRK